MKHLFKPEIVVDAEKPVAARNKLLKLLAQAELDGKIYSFTVPYSMEAGV